MKEYTYSEARHKLSTLLEEVQRQGVVCIRRHHGQAFFLKPAQNMQSPLDVKGLDLNITREEIVEYIHEGRRKEG